MASLDDLDALVSEELGTTETQKYTPDRRYNAINQAIRVILKRYDIPEYTVKVSLSVVNGSVALPLNFLRPAKLYKNKRAPYSLKNFDAFENDIPQTYTILWDTLTDSRVINTYPRETTVLTCWYIQIPDNMTVGSQTVRFKEYWDEAIAAKAAELLMRRSRLNQQAGDKKALADEMIADAWQSESVSLQGEDDLRLTSIYEDRPLLGSYSDFSSLYTYTDMGSSEQWLEIVANTNALVNYGYIANSPTPITLTLPLTANIGDRISLLQKGVGRWRIVQGNGQQIVFGDVTTTQGSGGYLESNIGGDAISLVCTTTNTTWTAVPGAVGNIDYV